jgi:hypothetical protein
MNAVKLLKTQPVFIAISDLQLGFLIGDIELGYDEIFVRPFVEMGGKVVDEPIGFGFITEELNAVGQQMGIVWGPLMEIFRAIELRQVFSKVVTGHRGSLIQRPPCVSSIG